MGTNTVHDDDVPATWFTYQKNTTPVAVAIVNHNTRNLLKACLETALLEAPHELIVVDNASIDGSVRMIQIEFPHVELVANAANHGFGAAANQALAACTAPYVLLLNGDTQVQPGALRALSAYLDSHPKAAVVGPQLLNLDGTVQASTFPFPTPLYMLAEESRLGKQLGRLPLLRDRYLPTWPHTSTRRVPWVRGAALAIRRAAFEAVNGFDESFYMYFEEVDLCYRLAVAGWQVHFSPVATVVHVGSASTNQQRSDMTIQFFTSMRRFYRQHYPRRKLIQLTGVVKSTMLLRWIRDALRLRLTRDARQRTRLAEDVVTWQSVLFAQNEP